MAVGCPAAAADGARPRPRPTRRRAPTVTAAAVIGRRRGRPPRLAVGGRWRQGAAVAPPGDTQTAASARASRPARAPHLVAPRPGFGPVSTATRGGNPVSWRGSAGPPPNPSRGSAMHREVMPDESCPREGGPERACMMLPPHDGAACRLGRGGDTPVLVGPPHFDLRGTRTAAATGQNARPPPQPGVLDA